MNSHARLLKLGIDRDPVIATQLLQAYFSHPSPPPLSYADRLFSQVPYSSRDQVLWTALLSSYSRSGHCSHALFLFSQLLHLSPRPNPFAFSSAARAAASASDFHLSQSLHGQVLRRGFLSNVVVTTSLLDAYSKCDDMTSARTLFDEMPNRNVFSWNSVIAGYANAGMGVSALQLFYRMKCFGMQLGVGVDEFTVASALTACSGIGDVRSGLQIHGFVLTVGLEADSAIVNAVANMYFRCGDVNFAERAMEASGYRSVVSKLMMIKGYVFNERYSDAIRTACSKVGAGLRELVEKDLSVLVSVLSACAHLGFLRLGRQVHGLIFALGAYDVVLGGALIDMYCKCSGISEAQLLFGRLQEKHVSHWNVMIMGFIHDGLLVEARCFFDDMPERNIVSWTAMISGYAQHGLPQEGLRLLARLYGEGGSIQGNEFTFVASLYACSCLAALDAGKQIHAQAMRILDDGGLSDVVVETALVDMYSKSGNLKYARRIFDRMVNKNVVSWTSMITGYATHGLGSQAIKALEQMMGMKYEPNRVTFVAILSACSHCGLVEQGIHYFNLMREKYNIIPEGDHYACMIDMLGRAGRLREAWKLVEEVKDVARHSVEDKDTGNGEGASVLGALLGGCRLHGNAVIGSKVATKMLKRKQQISDTFVALSNVYAAAEMWDKVYRVREEWRKQGAVKVPGQSQVQIGAST
ncbi:pentatricopeptide repeat-containing protein At2g13600-like [Typha latifolia]|uniref:pentatricopeptide repeat-containing protein At2g13600-like n=1 Tax=Typha latifolia TaxID=4733 RepID=UPI003C307FE9